MPRRQGHPRVAFFFALLEPPARRRAVGARAPRAVRRRERRAARAAAARADASPSCRAAGCEAGGRRRRALVDDAQARARCAALRTGEDHLLRAVEVERQRAARRRGDVAGAPPALGRRGGPVARGRRRRRAPPGAGRARLPRLAGRRGAAARPRLRRLRHRGEAACSSAAPSSTPSPPRCRGCATRSSGWKSGSGALARLARLARIFAVGLRFGLHEFVPRLPATAARLSSADAGAARRSACARRSRPSARSSSSSARCCRRGATCCRSTSPTSWRSCRTRCRRFPRSWRVAGDRALARPADRRGVRSTSSSEPVASASVAQVHFATLHDGARGGGEGAAARRRAGDRARPGAARDRRRPGRALLGRRPAAASRARWWPSSRTTWTTSST